MPTVKKIYAAEDDPVNAKIMKGALEACGKYEVRLFSDGVACYQETVQEPPDMLILDVLLPSASGLAMAKLISRSEEFSKIPVILVSSVNERDIQSRAMDAGAKAFLMKPCKPEDLVAEVEKIFA